MSSVWALMRESSSAWAACEAAVCLRKLQIHACTVPPRHVVAMGSLSSSRQCATHTRFSGVPTALLFGEMAGNCTTGRKPSEYRVSVLVHRNLLSTFHHRESGACCPVAGASRCPHSLIFLPLTSDDSLTLYPQLQMFPYFDLHNSLLQVQKITVKHETNLKSETCPSFLKMYNQPSLLRPCFGGSHLFLQRSSLRCFPK